MGPATGKLAVIAGQGGLPETLANNARQQGHEVIIFAVSGQADAAFSGFDCIDIPLGAIGRTRDLLVEAGCTRMVMAGKIRRPSLAQLKPDAAAVKLLAKAVGRGDDALLRVIAGYFAEAGIETVAPDSFMPRSAMPKGVLAGKLDAELQADIDLGLAVLNALGEHDVGQSIIIQDRRVIAVEAAEGTDAMLARSKALLDRTGPAAVFVKCRKSGQDDRLDVPVVGVETLRSAAAAGVSVLALQADGVMLAAPPETLGMRAADLELTVVGV
ncbi:MAG: UDP-2,3-diacylglucosamine diphosphatase LpxI [Rhodobiaceae bacterium]|jgi:DUF1009 family protein